MKLYTKLITLCIFLLVSLFPILPSYGTFSADLLIYVLFCLQFIGFILFKEERKNTVSAIKYILKNKFFISIICLNLLMYFSSIVALNKHIALTNSIRFSFYIFILYTISFKLESKKIIKNIVNCMLFVGLLSAIVSMIQTFKLYSNNLSLQSDYRIASFLENTNNLGVYSTLLLFLSIMILLNSNKKNEKISYTVISIFLTYNIICSQSRNALISLIIGIFLIALIYNKRYFIYSMFIPIALLIIPISRHRIFQILDPSQNQSRFKIWGLTEVMINNNKLFGLGYENFQTDYKRFVNSNPGYLISPTYNPLHPHNAFLKFQVELGIFGTVLFLSFIFLTSIYLYRRISKSQNLYFNTLVSSIFVCFITFQFMNILDCFYTSNKIMILLMILLGLTVYIDSLEKKMR